MEQSNEVMGSTDSFEATLENKASRLHAHAITFTITDAYWGTTLEKRAWLKVLLIKHPKIWSGDREETVIMWSTPWSWNQHGKQGSWMKRNWGDGTERFSRQALSASVNMAVRCVWPYVYRVVKPTRMKRLAQVMLCFPQIISLSCFCCEVIIWYFHTF